MKLYRKYGNGIIREVLDKYSPQIEVELNSYLSQQKPANLYQPLRELFSRGGKRIRPLLCAVSAEVVGGNPNSAIRTGAAIEMLHNFTLVHDDIADKSQLRRGKPCLHKIYGEGLAINAGDGLFTLAYEALCANFRKLDAEKAQRILETITSSIKLVCEGQAMDIGWTQDHKWDLNEYDYFEMVRRKTAALISASCECGGIIGCNNQEWTIALRNFGESTGIAFQIYDDVLNITGDEKTYGKEIGGDINEGKRTLMVIHALSKCDKDERRELIGILDKNENTLKEIERAISIINSCDSVEYARKKAAEFTEAGKKQLRKIPDSDAKIELAHIADYFIKRKI